MMYDSNSQQVELFINVWTSEVGQLFDYNTTEAQQPLYFKSMIFKLSIPKHDNSNHYYYMHQSVYKEDKHKIILERRTHPISKFDRKYQNAKGYNLIGGFRLYSESVSGYTQKKRVYFQPISAEDILQTGLEGKEQHKDHKKAYLVVRSFPDGYQIKTGQIIKMGKIQYKIQEMNNGKSSYDFLYGQDEILRLDQTFSQEHERSFQKQCKVCYCSQETGDNLLITPCNCKGSAAYIHIECLKTWMNTKITQLKQKEGMGKVYYTDKLECQICKKTQPKKIIVRGKEHIILNFIEEETPFIGIKNINSELAIPELQTMYISVVDEQVVTVGRLQQNQVHIFDNSVSRKHAQIELRYDKFFLVDSKSKFGTLVHEKGAKVRIHKNSSRAVQLGNVVFGLRILEY